MKIPRIILLIPALFALTNCNKSESVVMNSSTLKIIKSPLSNNDYYIGHISLINDTPSYRIPSKLDKVSINDQIIESKDYTYDYESGSFKIGYKLITGPVTITAEASEIYNVFINSSTLVIDKNYAYKNEDCNITISVESPSSSREVPSKLTSVKVDGVSLEEKDYTYLSGHLTIPSSLVKGDIAIEAEMYDKKDYSYEVVFSNQSCETAIYETNDYTKTPIIDTVAFSKDGASGKLLKNGKGEVNFKVIVPDNYDIDYIWVKGLYDDIKIKGADVDEFIYRINKIRSDLTVKIKTKLATIKNVCYNYDANKNSFNFSWDQREKGNIDYINVVMKDASGNIIDNKNVNDKKYSYSNSNVMTDKPYYFTFTPYYRDGSKGGAITYSKMINERVKTNTFPRIEINTKDNLELTNHRIDDIRAASLSENVKSNVKIFKNNVEVYKSSDEGTFEGAKTKIRGNSTALRYDKKPYKIKLIESVDLLQWFEKGESGVNYKHKEWNLISPDFYRSLLFFDMSSEILRFPIGFEIAKILNFEWVPRYTFVELYLNNDYKGLYILSEAAAKGEGAGDEQTRFKIDDDGYLIEKDVFSPFEDLVITSKLPYTLVNLDYTFKYPDTSSINEESSEYTYIKNDINEIEELTLKNSFNELNERIDFETFAKWMIGQDIVCNEDYYGCNMYIYRKNKNLTSKIKMGTIWDFDETLNTTKKHAPIRNKNYFFLGHFIKMPEFNAIAKQILNSIQSTCLNDINKMLNDRFDNDLYDKQIEIESARWNISSVKSMANQKESVLNFINTQLNWLISQY